MKKAAFFHTTMNTPLFLRNAFLQSYPEAELITVMDDSIVPEFQRNGNDYTPGIVRRLVSFGLNAQMQGAAAAVCMCTTITGAVAEAAKALDIPFLTIDGPMLDAAVRAGERLALLVTAETTLRASEAAARAAAKKAGREHIVIDVILVPGAFAALNTDKDKARHDALIAECAGKAAQDHDAVALAQVSMVDAAALLEGLAVPVFTSLESGIGQLAPYVE